MKVGSANTPPNAEKKINKKPRIAVDSAFKKTRSGLKIYVEHFGEGKALQKGDKVKVHYEGWLAEDYTMFDSSRKKRKPYEFVLGENQVIPGWEEAMSGVKEGSKIQLIVPPELAYGQQGFDNIKIPPNATLIFQVEILRA
ncbi:MAG: FKBP-type peptidyl-prolyl cis-trans isomerase [SAR324 cluster bacterium]|nr:FKBP-type peptidyl-prolyl cis-trans isomerase [SAR324 cluster bacterium]